MQDSANGAKPAPVAHVGTQLDMVQGVHRPSRTFGRRRGVMTELPK